MRHIAFFLSMPNVGSWNGQWSGHGGRYVIVKSFRNKSPILENLTDGSWSYNFGDGWGASVRMKEVDATTARKLKKDSDGFCGYDWMIASIISHGEIRNSLGKAHG